MKTIVSGVAAALAAVVAVPVSVSAQEAVIDPVEAKQCSVWASYLASRITDEQTLQALLFATNYFTGYYEGATGRAIGDDKDVAPLLEVEADLERFTEICATHMEGFGARMGAWGDFLSTLEDEAAG